MEHLLKVLEDFKSEKISTQKALELITLHNSVDLGFANVDIHRNKRNGFSEVIYGAGKTPEQVRDIAIQIYEYSDQVLITRITDAHAVEVQKIFPQAIHHKVAHCITIVKKERIKYPNPIAVLCAGTSDIPVAEEAAITADIMGNDVLRIYDIGVAGIHRLFSNLGKIRKAAVLIVVAGMEGALPSVVAGLVSHPVIAVPTSIGYGANFGGISALLGMLNSCGSGITVVNIDNGFGAAYAASQINSLCNNKIE